MSNKNNPFEFFQQFWTQAISGAAHFAPPISVEEIEQKITELVTVEQWLKMQLALVEGSIKTLELQKSGLTAFTDKPMNRP